MKQYPTIPGKVRYGTYVWAFDKLDGSNVRAEWTLKKGFWKFGRRHGLLDDTNPILLKSEELIKSKYGEDLDKIFRSKGYRKVTCFFEFVGPNSFAGYHRDTDRHDVVLFDVAVEQIGFLPPPDFIKEYGHLHIPTLVFEGEFTPEIHRAIHKNELDGITEEGVVCKAMPQKRKLINFKVKTSYWYDKLKKLKHSLGLYMG